MDSLLGTYDMIASFRRFAKSAAAGCMALAGMITIAAASTQAAYVQNFDTVVPSGWVVAANNVPTGVPFWFQGIDPAVDPFSFPAFNGGPTSYAAASYTDGVSQIDTWLMSPVLVLNTGDTFSFYARQQSYQGPNNVNGYANALQARLSTSGASTAIGNAYGAVGDFTTLGVDINPLFNQTGMPDAWTEYNFVYNGPAATGRVGFRFYTPDTNQFGSYIGVDAFQTSANLVPEPASFVLMGIGLAGLAYRRYRNRTGS